jgi:hypothetical protein
LTSRHQAISVNASPSSSMTAMSVTQVRAVCFHSGSAVPALAAVAVWVAVPGETSALPEGCAFAG